MAKRHYKKNRKSLSAFDSAYQSYSRIWSTMVNKAKKEEKPNPFGGEERMDKEAFFSYVDSKGYDVDVADKATLLKVARQRVAAAAHQLTTEQAKNLKRELLNLSDEDLKVIGMERADIKTMTLEAMKFLPSSEKGKAMISQFYEVLTRGGLTTAEAGEWISVQIYGSD